MKFEVIKVKVSKKTKYGVFRCDGQANPIIFDYEENADWCAKLLNAQLNKIDKP